MWIIWLFLAVVYISICLTLLLYIGLPIAVIGGLAGLVVGFCTTHVLTAGVLTGRIPAREIIGPADVTKLGVSPAPGATKPDPAWPRYFLGQVNQDIRTAAERAHAYVTLVQRRITQFGGQFGYLWPATLVAAVVAFAWAVGVYLGLLLVVVVMLVVGIVARGLGVAVGGALRGGDHTWQRVMHAKATCPTCYYLTSLPVYLCPRCAAQHRYLRPGRLGILRRYCTCGQPLPTTIRRASHRLGAICPRSSHPLPRGAAAETDVRVPVFGASSSGKTRLIMGGLVALVADEPAEAEAFVDAESRRAFQRFKSTWDAAASTVKTAAALPVAVTLRLTTGSRKSLVHVFDAAGEHFVHGGRNDELAYLDDARTLVFVLDPFSIPDVRGQLGTAYRKTLQEANAAVHDPEDSYNVTVQRLRAHGVRTERQRLAFVVSKSDLLDGLPVAAGLVARSESVAAWLRAKGLDNFLTAAERDFREVRYFLVASTSDADEATSARQPFSWLLEHERISLLTVGGRAPGGTGS